MEQGEIILIQINGKDYYILKENFSYIQKLLDEKIILPVIDDYAPFWV